MMNNGMIPGIKGVTGSFVLLAAFLASWQWGPGLLGVPKYIIPPASDVYNEFFFLIERERLFYHSLITGYAVVVGFVLGSALGIVVGYILGISRDAEVILSPYILALQIAPKVAFAPLFVLWFGYTIYPKILVAVLIVFFPVMVNVLTAIRTVDPDLINLARAFSGTRWQIFRIIEFHAAMPPLFSGWSANWSAAMSG
jgi:NitT/TauT family transport system permease protein